MTLIFNFFLLIHILSGAVGLLSGLINIIQPKGNKRHKFIGRIFFVSMIIVGISSLILSYINPNYFLFIMGVFTLYMVVSAQRYLKHKRPRTHFSQLTDWIITMTMLAVCLIFLGLGVWLLIQSNMFGIVFLTFGGLSLMFISQDIRYLKKRSKIKNYWLLAHLQRMVGSFIAALTAFLVVNAQYFPEQIPSLVFWLVPTIVLTPFIVKWSKKHRIKS